MPETRLLAVAGLGLDRPWPELGPERGAQRREQARAALVQLADAARRGADALVVAGGLLDRRSVEPATIDLLARLFEAIAVPVLLVPGALDWYSEDSPLATTDWPPNVHVVTDPSGEPFALPTGLVLWGCAVASPLHPQLSMPGPGASGGGVHLAVLPAAVPVEDRDLDEAGVSHAVVAHPDVAAWRPRVTTTGRAVPADLGSPSSPCAVALTVDAAGRLVSRDVVELPVPALTVAELDAGAYASGDALAAAVQQAAGAGAAAVRLTGTLPSGVLLPHLLATTPDVPVDASALEYDLALPPQNDATAAAEFLRDLAERPEPLPDRHQAAALGLLALDSARASTTAGGS